MTEEVHNIELPEELIGGVYADFVSVWHTGSVFTLDFAALAAPPEQQQNDIGEQVIYSKSQIVSRVRIPPAQVFEIMKALEHQLTSWEQEQGKPA